MQINYGGCVTYSAKEETILTQISIGFGFGNMNATRVPISVPSFPLPIVPQKEEPLYLSY